jgi:hypothetical protein
MCPPVTLAQANINNVPLDPTNPLTLEIVAALLAVGAVCTRAW